jgi:hypothetical protein
MHDSQQSRCSVNRPLLQRQSSPVSASPLPYPGSHGGCTQEEMAVETLIRSGLIVAIAASVVVVLVNLALGVVSDLGEQYVEAIELQLF